MLVVSRLDDRADGRMVSSFASSLLYLLSDVNLEMTGVCFLPLKAGGLVALCEGDFHLIEVGLLFL